MSYRETSEKINSYRKEISELRAKMREAQSSVEPEEVKTYEFSTLDGKVGLADLFGDKDHLFIVHNMGRSCPYCTLWADGFSGVIDHLSNRASFVISSPDNPSTQKEFADSRGWRFKMVSHDGTSFAEDMGYKMGEGYMPGVSVFKKENGKVMRVSDTQFGPGDDFCSIWHLFDLMPEGVAGWEAKFSY